jgi:hypothetical protein
MPLALDLGRQRREPPMSWLGFVAFFLVWVFVQSWLLPRLGVPT